MSTEKLILSMIITICFVVGSSGMIRFNKKLDDVNNDLKEFIQNSEQKDSDFMLANSRIEQNLNILNNKVNIVEESIDPQDSRWAKIKKVREVVKLAHEHFEIQTKMSSPELTRYASAVVESSEQYDVPISLVLAMCQAESAFNPKATSHVGARGMMQVMPRTAQKEIAPDLGIRHYNLYKIADAVKFGTYYIMEMIDEFEDVSLAVRAYNCGPTCVKSVVAGDWEDYPRETRGYVKKILGTDSEPGFIHFYQEHGL